MGKHPSIRVSKVVIPNAVTGLAIFIGYLSVMHALQRQYLAAAWLILLAAFLDWFDGRIARRTNTTSDFGAQFDSLADIINYGVAPSILFYRIYFVEWDFLGMLLSFTPTICGAVRLSRFTVDAIAGGYKTYFTGLPTTMAAAFLASFVIFTSDLGYGSPYLAVALLLAASLLMVSDVWYGKNSGLSLAAVLRSWKGTICLLLLATLILFPTKALFLWSALYIGYGLARSVMLTIADRRQERIS